MSKTAPPLRPARRNGHPWKGKSGLSVSGPETAKTNGLFAGSVAAGRDDTGEHLHSASRADEPRSNAREAGLFSECQLLR
jgi:hypothetical protein